MSLIICPECGKEVSNQAETCVHCGCPIKKDNSERKKPHKEFNRKKIIIVVVAILTLLAVGIAVYFLSDRHEHEFAEVKVINATCVEDGMREFACSICNETYQIAIPKTGVHKYAVKQTVQATCEKDGYKTFACTKCSDTYKETLNKTGHQWSKATCTASKKCANCGKQEGGTIAHNFNALGICSMCKVLDESKIDVSKFVSISGRSDQTGKIEDNVVIKSGTTVSWMGMLAKNVVIEPGAKLILMGMVGGDLIICKGGKAQIMGTVGGQVRGSGYIDHYGMIGREIDSTLSGYIHKGAYIGGYQYTKDTTLN